MLSKDLITHLPISPSFCLYVTKTPILWLKDIESCLIVQIFLLTFSQFLWFVKFTVFEIPLGPRLPLLLQNLIRFGHFNPLTTEWIMNKILSLIPTFCEMRHQKGCLLSSRLGVLHSIFSPEMKIILSNHHEYWGSVLIY